MTEMRISKNPITGRHHPLPLSESDAHAIDGFVAANRGRRVVVVQGLGFVGSVMALVCANATGEQYAVIGVDLATEASYWRIAALNEGVFPVVAEDPKIEEYFSRARRNNRFYATHDPYAYSQADVIVVDVNLDVAKKTTVWRDTEGYEVDLSSFRAAIEAIGRHCRDDALILVETTVPPGTCEKVVWPILMQSLAGRGLPTSRVRLGHSYERVMPGPNYIDSICKCPRVYAGVDEASAEATEAFLSTVIDTRECLLRRLGNTNASEMAKVLENAFRAMNIAFVVEWSRFAEEAGVNLYEVVDAIRKRPTHANLMYPGIGVGGYCLTKDPLLASWSRQHMFNGGGTLTQSERAVSTNDKMPEYAFKFLAREYGADLKGRRVLLLGVSYRGEVGDTRFSPVDLFFDHLVASGAVIDLHDPYVRHWPEKDLLVEQDLLSALTCDPDIVVVSTAHRVYGSSQAVDALTALAGRFLYDTVGIWSPQQIMTLSSRHRVKVLGRGDL